MHCTLHGVVSLQKLTCFEDHSLPTHVSKLIIIDLHSHALSFWSAVYRMTADPPPPPQIVRKGDRAPLISSSGVATPGPTRALALVKFVCALIKLLNSQT